MVTPYMWCTMKCPYCSSDDIKVIEKRDTEDGMAVRRRRECNKCSKRFTTYERIESTITVIKKDGKREMYDRDKIKRGILKACEKLPVTAEQIEKIINEIEAKLRSLNSTEIPSKKIGELVMKKLKSLDKVAYVRFASVYKSFEDIESFEEELKKIKR